MNRRTLALGAGACAALSLLCCDSEPKPSATATLLNSEKVHTAMTSLMDAISALEREVANFDDTNWRDVVPEVRSATASVSSAAEELRAALGYSS